MSFTVDSTSVGSATTDGSGTATLSGVDGLNAGNYSVEASFVGDSTYDPTSGSGSGSGTLSVSQTSQSITFTSSAPTDATVGGSYTVSATASSSLTVSLASTTTSVCTVSGSTVSFIAAGTCTVSASQSGDAKQATPLTSAALQSGASYGMSA